MTIDQGVSNTLESEGFAVIPGVLTTSEVTAAREALVRLARENERAGTPTHVPALDPNAANIRVFNLIDGDPVFRDLIMHPEAIALVSHVLSEHFLISNFTANIARPGSGSMPVHSDQAIVVPEPWLAPWSMNIIWCLDDVHEANGATRYLPGSHRITRLDELPDELAARMKSFEAAAGDIIAMDGRLWHTSGENRTTEEERALLFGYYSADFLRPQTNWNASLSPATINTVDSALHARLGLGAAANLRQGGIIFNEVNP